MAGFGLQLAKSAGMEGFSGNLQEFRINPANSGSIYKGDVVTLTSGWVVEATGGADNSDFDILGVFYGCQYVDSDGSFEFMPSWNGGAGRSLIKAQIAMPSHSLFWVKGLAGTVYTQAAFGGRFGIDYTAGSHVYGRSGVCLTAAAAATGPLRVHRLAPIPGNVIGQDQPIFECSIVRPLGGAA